MGRKRIEIDWNYVDEMLEAGCDGTEVAASLGMHKETLYDRVKEEFNTDFSDYKAQKKAKGDQLLRKKQFDIAKEGDKSMLIWLGKQRLGQSDKTESKVKNTEVKEDIDYSKLSDDALREIANATRDNSEESKDRISEAKSN